MLICHSTSLEGRNANRCRNIRNIVFDLEYSLSIDVADIFPPPADFGLCNFSFVLIFLGSPCSFVCLVLCSQEYISVTLSTFRSTNTYCVDLAFCGELCLLPPF